MKRIMQLLLAGVLCFVFSFSALADADQSTVQKVQQALNEAGFDCGTPDGVFGSKTSGAISDYQKANAMDVTGQIDDALLAKMGLAETAGENEVSTEDTSAGQSAAPDVPKEEVTPDYEGKWVDLSDEFEIFLPAGMKQMPEEEFPNEATGFMAKDTGPKPDKGMTPTIDVEMSEGGSPEMMFQQFLFMAGKTDEDIIVINGIEGFFTESAMGESKVKDFFFRSDTANYIMHIYGITEENEDILLSVFDTLRAK